MKTSILASVVLSLSLLFACGGTVETSSCGPSGCTSSRSGSTGPQAIGGACSNAGECQGSMVCATGVPNGYCTQVCATSAQCPSGAICVGDSSGGSCLKGCSSSSDCRPGYSCQTLTNGKGVCDVK